MATQPEGLPVMASSDTEQYEDIASNSNDEPDQVVATSFEKYFPRLPLEIQRQIYQATLPKPRFIEASFYTPPPCIRTQQGYLRRIGPPPTPSQRPFGWHISANIPAFSICPESRSEAAKTYKMGTSVSQVFPKVFYMDNEKDTLYLNASHVDFGCTFWGTLRWRQILEVFTQPTKNKRIKHLAVDVLLWPYLEIDWIVWGLPHLETMTFVYDYRKIPARFIDSRLRQSNYYIPFKTEIANIIQDFNWDAGIWNWAKKRSSSFRPKVQVKANKGNKDADGDIIFEDISISEIEVLQPRLTTYDGEIIADGNDSNLLIQSVYWRETLPGSGDLRDRQYLDPAGPARHLNFRNGW